MNTYKKDSQMINDRTKIAREVFLLLKKQGKLSISELEYGNTRCSYRSDDGSKCGIGFLILDECYSMMLEGKLVRDYHVIEALEKSRFGYISENFASFLGYLQSAHDDLNNSTSFTNGEYSKDELEASFRFNLKLYNNQMIYQGYYHHQVNIQEVLAE